MHVEPYSGWSSGFWCLFHLDFIRRARFLAALVVFVSGPVATRRGDQFWHYIWRRYLRRLLWR